MNKFYLNKDGKLMDSDQDFHSALSLEFIKEKKKYVEKAYRI